MSASQERLRRGFTLVETMMVASISIIVLTAVMSSFMATQNMLHTAMAESELSLAMREMREKLLFKASYITNINHPLLDKSKLQCVCGGCQQQMKRMSDWKTINQAFSALFYCKNCEKLVRYSVRFKEYYDRVETKSAVSEIRKSQEGE